jgi:2-hydroxychromene-2-carboxylate isomerase
VVTFSSQPGDNILLSPIQSYFDFGSPTSYLASRALPVIAREVGATIDWKPILPGGIFQSTGNASPMDMPQKAAWMRTDLQRWAKKRNAPYEFNPFFPINTLVLQRGAAAYQGGPLFDHYVQTVFSAMWEKPQILGNPATLTKVLSDAGFNADEFIAFTGSPEVKARLRANTDEAISKGVFGCPTCFVGDESQDRLDFVRDALRDAAQ